MNNEVRNILVRKSMIKNSSLIKEIDNIRQEQEEKSPGDLLEEYLLEHPQLTDYKYDGYRLDIVHFLQVPIIESLSNNSFKELLQFCKCGILEVNFYITNYIATILNKKNLFIDDTIIYIELNLVDTPINVDNFRVSEKLFFLIQKLFIKYGIKFNVTNEDEIDYKTKKEVNKSIDEFIQNNSKYVEQLEEDEGEDHLDIIEDFIKYRSRADKIIKDIESSVDESIREVWGDLPHDIDDEDMEGDEDD